VADHRLRARLEASLAGRAVPQLRHSRRPGPAREAARPGRIGAGGAA
jgi:hypothetical protein